MPQLTQLVGAELRNRQKKANAGDKTQPTASPTPSHSRLTRLLDLCIME